MACGACEHCHGPLDQQAILREGCSYHQTCHKCYVCSETDLHNAEVFKGVIFCRSCSQRIFQGCSAVRHTKNTERSGRVRSRSKRSKRRRLSKTRLQRESGVIELARMGRSTDSGSYSDRYVAKAASKSSPIHVTLEPVTHEEIVCAVNTTDLKTESAEMGIATEFTQMLLKDLNCPVVEWMGSQAVTSEDQSAPLAKPPKNTQKEEKWNKPIWSDIRIAELGESTEIANMALRKRSDVRVRSEDHNKSSVKPMDSRSQVLSQLPDISDEELEEWIDSAYRSSGRPLRRPLRTKLMDRPVRSILKLPYKYFKTNILKRSSLITVVISGDNDYKEATFEKLKRLFHDEIVAHHHSGEQKLYPIINERSPPHKLGWLHLGDQVVKEQSDKCRHYRRSHSYRCLRAQVMTRAGPDRSQLAIFRREIRKLTSPKYLWKLLNSNVYPSVTTSETGEKREER